MFASRLRSGLRAYYGLSYQLQPCFNVYFSPVTPNSNLWALRQKFKIKLIFNLFITSSTAEGRLSGVSEPLNSGTLWAEGSPSISTVTLPGLTYQEYKPEACQGSKPVKPRLWLCPAIRVETKSLFFQSLLMTITTLVQIFISCPNQAAYDEWLLPFELGLHKKGKKIVRGGTDRARCIQEDQVR